MRASIRCAVVAGLALGAIACGEDGAGRMATGATPPDPLAKFQPVRIVSGADLGPVPGAAVVIEGSPYVTDPKGEVVPGGSSGAESGASIDVDAPGFLPRRTRIDDDRRVTLWPVASEAEAEAVRRMVYRRIGPEEVLYPPEPGPFTVRLDFWEEWDAEAWDVWRAEAEAFGRRFEISYALQSYDCSYPCEYPNGLSVHVTETGLCEAPPAWGFCQELILNPRARDYTVRPGKARDPQTVRRVLASWFLGPNPLPGLLNPEAPAGDLSPLEVQTIRMILQRRLPNRWPDTDR